MLLLCRYIDVLNKFFINVDFFPQAILLSSNVNPSTRTTGGVKTFQVRYILIPGGTTARTGNTVDWNDYNQVKAYLKLKD
jgi:hypothetical protein